MERKEMNIFEKMLEISSRIGFAKKDMTVGSGNYSYKAVSETIILSKVKPLEKEIGIYSYPVEREIIESGTLEADGRKPSLFLRVKVVYRFVNVDKPSEYIEIISYGDGVDSQDKATGKAMTYADKYALMKAYKIATGDDPDKDPSDKFDKVKMKNKYPMGEQRETIKLATASDIARLKTLAEQFNINDKTLIAGANKYYGQKSLDTLTQGQAGEYAARLIDAFGQTPQITKTI